MRAMALEVSGRPLRPVEIPDPVPGAGQALIRVHACGVCRTDLHIVAGELPHPGRDRSHPHAVRVCILREDNDRSVFDRLRLEAGPPPRTLDELLAQG